MPAPVRILLADDHAIVRKGIRDFLEEDRDLTVVAEATNGDEASAPGARAPAGRRGARHSDAGDERHRRDAPDQVGTTRRPGAGPDGLRGRSVRLCACCARVRTGTS